MKEYGISRPTVISLLKNQSATSKAVDSGIMNDNSKSLKKSPLAEVNNTALSDYITEVRLYQLNK